MLGRLPSSRHEEFNDNPVILGSITFQIDCFFYKSHFRPTNITKIQNWRLCINCYISEIRRMLRAMVRYFRRTPSAIEPEAIAMIPATLSKKRHSLKIEPSQKRIGVLVRKNTIWFHITGYGLIERCWLNSRTVTIFVRFVFECLLQ